MKKIVWVIGSGGILGEAIKTQAPNLKNYELRFTNRSEINVLNPSLSLPFSEGDIVVDLVPPPYVRDSSEISSENYHASYSIPHNLFMRQAMESGISKYIFVSSGGAIYGNNENHLPFRETDPRDPVSLYGKSKLMQENNLIELSKEFNRAFVILRPSNIFNILPMEKKQTGLIGVLKEKLKNHLPIEIFGDVEIAKDYISNLDVSEAIIACFDDSIEGEFNIGYGQVTTIKEILNAFEKSFEIKAEVIIKPFNPQDVRWFCLDISKAQRELNFKPKASLISWIATNTSQPS